MSVQYSYLAMDSIFCSRDADTGCPKGCDGVGGREGAAAAADWVELVGDAVVCEGGCDTGVERVQEGEEGAVIGTVSFEIEVRVKVKVAGVK